MPLSAGQRLGSYEIRALVGVGGMGEVYRAVDTQLKREVAVKVLPAAFADDPDRLARFQREAQLLATLNHPNIAQIYGVEHRALILELVDGPTLAELTLPLPPTDVLHIARQIADALEAAHEKGVIHRDLKPANIKLRPDGTVKVLDFGLAKAIADDGAVDVSHSPTQTVVATRAGVLIGTAAYMSPEQVRGKPADKRADIWAFGCVLYELLTGSRAFPGDTVSDTLVSILEREPRWDALPENVADPCRHLLRRCLAKDPKRRLRDIGDAQPDLDETPMSTVDRAHVPGTDRQRSSASAAITMALVAIIGIAGGWFLRSALTARAPSTAPAASELRLEITTPPTTDPVSFALSPDGQQIVYVATFDTRSVLWLRSLDATRSRPLPGTDDASFPFWSPGSRSVGFFASGQLKRIDLDTGAVQALAATSGPRGGAWLVDGTILYTASPGNAPLLRIAATGGTPATVVKQGRFPQVLPDGKHFIYFVPQAFTPDDRGIWVAALDGSGSHRLTDADSAAVFAPSGHVLFVRQGTLVAQQIDLSSLTLQGSAFSVAADMSINEPPLVAGISTSAAGPIAYRSGSAGGMRQVAWFDRSGALLEKVGTPFTNIRSPSMSPDGSQLAFHRTINGNSDIWVLDIRRGVLSRFTSDPAGDFYPLWSTDGASLFFERNRDIYQKPTTGSGAEELLLATPVSKNPTSMSRDGRFLLYFTAEPKPSFDIWALPLRPRAEPRAVVHTDFDERDGQFSPDGKWMSFESNESGRLEVYVQPFPGPGAKMQISSNGGAMARWRDDGKELFYVSLDEQLMSVPLRLEANTLRPGTPTPLFRVRVGGAQPGNSGPQYVVSPDGKRFLINTLAEELASPITIILNWKAKP